MSTLKADAITAVTSNTDVVITGAGSGVPDIEAGFKVGGTAKVPVSELRTSSGTASSSTFLRGDGTWNAAGGGSWNFISKVTASAQANITFTSGIDSTYPVYVFVITHMRMETSGSATDFEMHVSNDAGSTWQTSGYTYHFSKVAKSSTSYSAIASTGDSDFPVMDVPTDDDYHWNGMIYMYDPSNTTMTKVFKVDLGSAAYNYEINGIANWVNNTNAITGIKFELGSGDDIREGVISMYGISAS